MVCMTGLGLIATLVLFVGGILMLGNAFLIPSAAAFIFVGGIIAISISLAIAFHILPKTE